MPTYSTYPAIINGNTLPNLASLEPDVNAEIMTVSAGGLIDPVAFSLAFRDSKTPYETADLKTLIDGIGIDVLLGKPCPSGATFQFQKADNGTFSSGSNHVTVVSANGYTYLQELSASQDDKEPAKASCEYCFLKDASGAYVTTSPGAPLAGSPGLENYYALGPVYHNGGIVQGITRARLTTGIRYRTIRADGETEAAEGVVEDRNLQLECDLMSLAGAVGLNWGLSPSSGPVSMYLAKCISGAGRVAYGTSEHIKATFATSAIELRGIKRGKKSDALATLIFHLVGAGFSITTASAIP